MKKSTFISAILAIICIPIYGQQSVVGNYVYSEAVGENWFSFDYDCAMLLKSDFKENYPEGDVTAPSEVEIDGNVLPVAQVMTSAFNWMAPGQRLILPECVEVVSNLDVSCNATISFSEQSIKCLGGYAFGGATLKEEIQLPNVGAVQWNAFQQCNVNRIIFGPELFLLGYAAFQDSPVSEILFDDGATESLNISCGAFYLVNNIRELVLPKRPKLRLGGAFVSNCASLQRMVFPDMPEYIYTNSSYDDFTMKAPPVGEMIEKCPSLAEVVCLSNTPPQWADVDKWEDKFDHKGLYITDNMDECVLKVPAGSEELYRADPVWGKFKTIYGFENGDYTSIVIPEVAAPDAEAVPVYHNLQGMKVERPEHGQLYIRTVGSRTDKVVF